MIDLKKNKFTQESKQNAVIKYYLMALNFILINDFCNGFEQQGPSLYHVPFNIRNPNDIKNSFVLKMYDFDNLSHLH